MWKKKREPLPRAGGGSKKMKVVAAVPPCPITIKANWVAITSWSQGFPLESLMKALKDWDGNTGDAFDSNTEAAMHYTMYLNSIIFNRIMRTYIKIDI
jgi:hypothetical protein